MNSLILSFYWLQSNIYYIINQYNEIKQKTKKWLYTFVEDCILTNNLEELILKIPHRNVEEDRASR
jgi:hypothetical protein